MSLARASLFIDPESYSMKRSYVVATVLIYLTAMSGKVHAQFGAPNSDTVFGLEIVTKDGAFVVAIRDGTMAIIRSDAYWYGIVPSKGKDDADPVLFFSLQERLGGAPSVSEEGSATLRHGKTVSFKNHNDDGVKLTLRFVEVWNFPGIKIIDRRGVDPKTLQKLYGASSGGLCSVTCRGLTVTSTQVVLPCGSCDSQFSRQ